MTSFNVQFPFVVRQAVQVATSIARAIQIDLRHDRQLLESGDTHSSRIPVLLRVESLKNGVIRCRFEGGTVVDVSLFNKDDLLEGWRSDGREDWVVYQATARYYQLDASYQRVSDTKSETQLDSDALRRLRDSTIGWYHPHVASIEELTGDVGIFWNNAAADGYVEADPDRNQEGHYTLCNRVSYQVLVAGDRDRAIREAKERLANY